MKNESRISVRTLTAMALLIAMSIVFSRVLSISTGFVPVSYTHLTLPTKLEV